MTSQNTKAAVRAQAIRRARAIRWTYRLAIWVGVPTLLAVLYYGAIASDEYESVALFSVQSGAQTEGDAEARRAQCESDAQLVRDLALSRRTYQLLDADHGLAEHFAGADFGSRLSSHASRESAYDFFLEKVSISKPNKACTVTVRALAFSSAMAQSLAMGAVTRAVETANETLGITGTEAAKRVVFLSPPSRPDEAALPRRAWKVLTVAVVSLCLLFVVTLLGGAVREHGNF